MGLDIGTTKVTAIVAEVTEEGRDRRHRYRHGTESKGLRKGMVINLEQTVESIKRVRRGSGAHGRSRDRRRPTSGSRAVTSRASTARAVVAITNKNREISREDVFRAIDAAKAISLPNDREIVHVVPQEFVVDAHDGIHDPTGNDRVPDSRPTSTSSRPGRRRPRTS